MFNIFLNVKCRPARNLFKTCHKKYMKPSLSFLKLTQLSESDLEHAKQKRGEAKNDNLKY